MYEARNRCYRDLILKELHEMEMGKFLKERSEIVVNLETKIAELTTENENFYNKMREYKDELDVCKMEEIRMSGMRVGNATEMESSKPTPTTSWQHNQRPAEPSRGGPNSYLPLDRHLMQVGRHTTSKGHQRSFKNFLYVSCYCKVLKVKYLVTF